MRTSSAISVALFLGLMLTLSPKAHAQSPLRPLSQVLDSLSANSKYRFYVDTGKAAQTLVNPTVQGADIKTYLDKLLAGTTLGYTVRDWGSVYIYDKSLALVEQLPADFMDVAAGTTPGSASLEQQDGRNSSKDPSIENKLIEIGRASARKENLVRITGYVRDSRTGEALSGAMIREEKSGQPIVADGQGYYTITLKPGRHQINYTHAGMKSTRRQVMVHESGKLDVDMKEDIPTLSAVVLVAEKNSNTRRLMMGVENLNVKTIRNVPALLGEPDILRVVMALPGVTSVGEASTGFNVRGGTADQNLVMFNGATIYNPSHVFGFFTAIDAESVKGVDLYKSSIPSKFGGRLSSVLDIEGKEGNAKEWKGSAGINVMTAKFNLEGPLVKEKTTISLGGRATYSNWLIKQIDDPEYNNSTANFIDGNIQINHKFSDKDRLGITVYGSQDGFQIAGDSSFNYGNRNIVARWKHVFNSKSSMLITGGYDGYLYDVKGDLNNSGGFQLKFRLDQFHLRNDFTYALNDKHTLGYGLHLVHYGIQPGDYQPKGSNSIVLPQTMEREQGLEAAAYVGDKWAVTDKLALEAGLRFSMFRMLGPRQVMQYVPGEPRTEGTIIDTVNYGKGANVKTYMGPEIRLAARQTLGDNTSLKASFNTLRQYIHLLTNTAAISPTDIWKLSDPYLRPQQGYQASLGIYHDIPKKGLETSLEVYYKGMKNILDFKSGADLLLNPHPETELVSTKGKAYGVEAMVRKTGGRLSGWLSYTYSRSQLKMDDSLAGQPINKGNWYPANFDKPHMANLVANYKFSHRIGLSVNMTYSTGRPVTLPIAIFYTGGGFRTYYSERNQYRIPDYFRLDAAMNLDGSHNLKQKFHLFWTIGAYNITGRDNPYSVYFTEENGQVKGYQLSVIGNIIPYITLNIKF